MLSDGTDRRPHLKPDFPSRAAERRICRGFGALLAIGVIFVGLVVSALLVASPSERWGAAGAALALATMAIAAVAAVVALLAWRATIQTPELCLEAAVTGQPPLLSDPYFAWMSAKNLDEVPIAVSLGYDAYMHKGVAFSRKAGCEIVRASHGTGLIIRLVNDSDFSARNPAVQVEVSGLISLSDATRTGWTTVTKSYDTVDGLVEVACVFQWDGGADLLVHGKWERVLPHLSLAGSFLLDNERPVVAVLRVVADALAPSAPESKDMPKVGYERHMNEIRLKVAHAREDIDNTVAECAAFLEGTSEFDDLSDLGTAT